MGLVARLAEDSVKRTIKNHAGWVKTWGIPTDYYENKCHPGGLEWRGRRISGRGETLIFIFQSDTDKCHGGLVFVYRSPQPFREAPKGCGELSASRTRRRHE
jgi:hypothetical protein